MAVSLLLLFAAATAAPGLAPELEADLALEQAAGALASLAASDGSLSRISDEEAVRLEITRAGAMVSEPWALGVVATDREAGRIRVLEKIAGLSGFQPTKMGLGTASTSDGMTVWVALLSRAPVDLDMPLPPRVEVGSLLHLQGRLLEGLRFPQVHVTPHGGRPVRLPLHREGERFHASLHLAREGRTTIEVVGVSASGPEVALLAHVYVGREVPAPTRRAPSRDAKPGDVEPRNVDWILTEIAKLRRERGLPGLRNDPLLERAARDHGAELSRTGRLSHLSEAGASVGDRVQGAGYRFVVVGENLGEGSTVEAAHRTILRSPAHLAAVLDPGFQEIGVAIAERGRGDGRTFIVVQVFASPRPD